MYLEFESRRMNMKSAVFFIIVVVTAGALQLACGNSGNANRSIANNQNTNSADLSAANDQNSVSASASPIQPTPAATSLPNKNISGKGISNEDAEPIRQLMERCKHAPTNDAKVSPLAGSVPLTVTFDGSASRDPDGTKLVKWKWLFGNGESSEGKKVTYIYQKPGKYGIGLDVTDAQGQKTSDCGTGATDIVVIVTDDVQKNN